MSREQTMADASVAQPPFQPPQTPATVADIAHAVADGKDLSRVWIHDLMTTHPTVINTMPSVQGPAGGAR